MSISKGTAQDFNASIQKLKVFNLDNINVDLLDLSTLEKEYLNRQKQLIIYGKVDSVSVNTIAKNNVDNYVVLNAILLGDFYLYKSIPEDSLAFDFYIKGLNSAITIKDTVLIAEASKKIMTQLFKSRRSLEAYPTYLNIYKKHLYDDNETANYIFHLNNYITSEKGIETTNEFKDGLLIANKTENSFIKAKYNQLIGVNFNYFKKERDSSFKYYYKAKKLLETKPYQYFRNELFGLTANIGISHLDKGNLKSAKHYFLEANKIQLPKYRYVEKAKLFGLLSTIAKKENKYDEAYSFLEIRNTYLDTLNEYTKAAKLNEINTKYQTEKKEKENLQLQAKVEKEQRQKRNLWIGALALLIFGSSIAFLLQKNTKRKQLIAEQEKELQVQKVSTILKEQELTSIDAMIEGQEKERQRIANDLHDDLGGLMATVKLHFNALKAKQTPELFDKTNNLLDEAYQKVRTIAHAKNSGVIAKQGLLKAVEEMAEKISTANKIKIEVIDHGLENRLENSLELTIFRIIQELTTNIIKHANATQATIHLTNHDNSLNILIEDNGVGFNPKTISTKKGMGIHSIDKRVEHLDGKLTIESETNQGTTVIIDIPT